MDSLKTGIIGVGGYGAKFLTELVRTDKYNVQAIADRDREIAQNAAMEYEARPYDDYRQLIMREDLEVLFLMLPNWLCGECIQLAGKKGVHIFKGAPVARNLPEAIQWTKVLEENGGIFQVDCPLRFAPAYRAAHELLAEGQLGQIYLVRGEYFWDYEGDFDWRGDPVLAGGGVLLEMAYDMMDQILWNMPTPDRLYCLNTGFCRKRKLVPYRTEDTATTMINFSDGSVGSLLCSWMTALAGERLIFHGTDGNLQVGRDYFQLYDAHGEIIRQEKFAIDDRQLIARQLEHFAQMIVDPETQSISPPKDHLVNIAAIEAAYLSAQTQVPETLKVYGDLFKLE